MKSKRLRAMPLTVSIALRLARAMPKSVSFTSPWNDRRMFGGETSRWMMFSATGLPPRMTWRWCAYSRPLSSSIAVNTACGTGSVRPLLPARRSTAPMSRPCTYSIAMYQIPSTCPRSRICTMFACESRPATLASSTSIAMYSEFCERFGRIRLIAKVRWKPPMPSRRAL